MWCLAINRPYLLDRPTQTIVSSGFPNIFLNLFIILCSLFNLRIHILFEMCQIVQSMEMLYDRQVQVPVQLLELNPEEEKEELPLNPRIL